MSVRDAFGLSLDDLSPKQRVLHERDQVILSAAKAILLEKGYFGLTMDRIAQRSECPKGTLYQRFASKEDVIIALAIECLRKRLDMVYRAAKFDGRPRERMGAIGEAVGLYSRLNEDESRILHAATGPIREKASAFRVAELAHIERETVALLRGVLDDAVARGDLVLGADMRAEVLVFAFWSLVEGSYIMIENGTPARALNIHNPFHEVWRVYNRMADSYGWRPLFGEIDWEECLANVRRKVFPDEAQQLFGEGNWYGDGR